MEAKIFYFGQDIRFRRDTINLIDYRHLGYLVLSASKLKVALALLPDEFLKNEVNLSFIGEDLDDWRTPVDPLIVKIRKYFPQMPIIAERYIRPKESVDFYNQLGKPPFPLLQAIQGFANMNFQVTRT